MFYYYFEICMDGRRPHAATTDVVWAGERRTPRSPVSPVAVLVPRPLATMAVAALPPASAIVDRCARHERLQLVLRPHGQNRSLCHPEDPAEVTRLLLRDERVG